MYKNGIKRYYAVDRIRGFAVFHMILYHGIWDLVNLFGMHWTWYEMTGAYIWQQFICWTFVLISGFCSAFGTHKMKRGSFVFLLGLLISAVTLIFMPEERILFGILTLIGSCMLLMIPAARILIKINPQLGLCGSAVLFVLTRNINHGYLGFEGWNIYRLPAYFYRNMASAYLGFPPSEFYSTDYFPIFPWIFLFMAGYFANRLMRKHNLLRYLQPQRNIILEKMGQYTLVIYILHQPILYGILQGAQLILT